MATAPTPTNRLSSCRSNTALPGHLCTMIPSCRATMVKGGSVPVAADGGTSSGNLLQRFYAGGLTACADASYEAALFGTTSNPGPAAGTALSPGMCGWTAVHPIITATTKTQISTHYRRPWRSNSRKDLSFNAQYAWQRSFNFNGGFYTWDKAATYGLGRRLRTQQFVVYGLYQLPFGKANVGKQRAALGRRGHWRMGVQSSAQLVQWLAIQPGPWAGVQRFHAWQRALLSGGQARSGLHTNLSSFNARFAFPNIFKDANRPTTRRRDWTSSATRDGTATSDRGTSTAISRCRRISRSDEAILAQFRVDAFNGFNHINPGNPVNAQTGSDGMISSEPALGHLH